MATKLGLEACNAMHMVQHIKERETIAKHDWLIFIFQNGNKKVTVTGMKKENKTKAKHSGMIEIYLQFYFTL